MFTKKVPSSSGVPFDTDKISRKLFSQVPELQYQITVPTDLERRLVSAAVRSSPV